MEPVTLHDKNGRRVKVGDKVRLPNGDVVKIAGSMPVRRRVSMMDCEVVPQKTKVHVRERPIQTEIMWG